MYRVTRYSIPLGDPDRLRVETIDGAILLDVSMGPGGILHPQSSKEAWASPWFFTGSPFGAQIIDRYCSRVDPLTANPAHALRALARLAFPEREFDEDAWSAVALHCGEPVSVE